MKKETKWVKFRHKVVVPLVALFFGPYVRLRYGIKIEPFREEKGRQYLVLMNHQTAYDQFFVGLSFRQPVYYLASEDIFSMGWISSVIRWLVAPIPIKKQTTDLQAVKNCIRVAREGGTLCIAPEGNRTYHGRTVYIKPSIASLAKKLGLPVAIYRIDGGYGVQPRWSDVVRKGKMRGYVNRVIEPEEFADMTAAQLAAWLEQELYVDEACLSGEYRHKKNAEFLERVVYTCPWCGLSPFESHDDVITCLSCRRQVRHKATKELEGVGCDFPHRFVADWYDWQNELVNGLDLTAMTETPVFTDQVRLSRVHAYKRKELLKENVTVCLYGDRITMDGEDYPFAQLGAVTVLGRNKLNVYTDTQILQLKGSSRFNALKYVNFFHRHKNIRMGDANGKFLGI